MGCGVREQEDNAEVDAGEECSNGGRRGNDGKMGGREMDEVVVVAVVGWARRGSLRCLASWACQWEPGEAQWVDH